MHWLGSQALSGLMLELVLVSLRLRKFFGRLIFWLTLLPMLPVMINLFKEIKAETWMYFVPIAGQQQLMTSVMRGEGFEVGNFAIAAVVTVVLAVGLFSIFARLLRSERVVFGS